MLMVEVEASGSMLVVEVEAGGLGLCLRQACLPECGSGSSSLQRLWRVSSQPSSHQRGAALCLDLVSNFRAARRWSKLGEAEIRPGPLLSCLHVL